MNPLEVIAWIAALMLSAAVGALAVIASARGRERLALPSLAPVALVLAAGALGALPAATAPPVLPALLGLVLAAIGVVAGSPLVSLVLSLSARGETRLGLHGGILVRDRDAPLPEREILRGGTTIGYLERFALIGSVVVGQQAAVALIVAVKGLGRFSELENERARERFIIGTLASLVWAGLCAVAVTLLR